MKYHCWCWPSSLGCSSVWQVSLPPLLPILHFGELVTMHSLHLKKRELYSPFWRAEYLHKLFVILLHERCVFSFNPWTWSHGNLFYNLGYNSILLYLFCCSNHSIFGHWELFHWFFQHTPIALGCPCLLVWLIWAFPYFLELQDTLDSSYRYPFSILESAISPRSCSFFY